LLILADSEKQLTTVYPVNLSDVVAHVSSQLTAEATAAGVELIRGPGDAPTRGDALLLERLVHNLVENGIRHNADPQAITIEPRRDDQAGDGGEPSIVMGLGSGPERWVSVISKAVGDEVQVVVTNTGPEIPPYEVESLFKPFYRLGAERLVGGKGAGLGLSIVRSVAEAHGGTVSAVPRRGGGLEITVVLPVDRD
jgi:signal transduction histidine kinase